LILSYCSRSRFHPSPPSFPTRRSSDLSAGTRSVPWQQTGGAILVQFISFSSQDPVATARSMLPLPPPTRRIPPFFSFGISSVFRDRKSTRLNSSHVSISYAVFCLKKQT